MLFVASAYGATFVVPADRVLVERATAIVIASSVSSRTELRNGAIETVTTMSVENVLKGRLSEEIIEVHEPGGVYAERATIFPGVPRFNDGERYILFLTNADGRWHVLDLVLGKFRFDTDTLGRQVALRDENEINGWDPDGTLHHEQNRDADSFLSFIRNSVRGGPARQNYFVPAEPLVTVFTNPRGIIANATFTATSYTFTVSGSLGGRWNVFPSAVSFFSVGTEPGAPGGGVSAINAAFGSWNGDPNSNVNYVYAGADNSGTHNGGVGGSDGQNTIAFERDLSAFGAPPFTCTSNSYSGTLGLGGITNASGTHTHPNGSETFATTHEGDVEMNKGIANCTLLFNSGDFDSAVAHEVGHTLGFRHSDQTRADNPSTPCSSDPTLECSSNAIMKSFVSSGLHAALQAYDQHAVAAVYPNTGGGTLPVAPTSVRATAVSTTQVNVTWTAVPGVGVTYQIFRKAPGGSFIQIGTSSTNAFSDTNAAPNTSYLYRVRTVTAAGASVDSAYDFATTVIFTDDPLVPRVTIIKAIHLAELRTAVNAMRAIAGLPAASFTDPATPGIVVKAVHITQLRTALDQAYSALGFTGGGWTDPSLGPGTTIRAVHFQEIRDRVK